MNVRLFFALVNVRLTLAVLAYGNGGGGGVSYLYLHCRRIANCRGQERTSAIKALPGVLASVFVLLYQEIVN